MGRASRATLGVVACVGLALGTGACAGRLPQGSDRAPSPQPDGDPPDAGSICIGDPGCCCSGGDTRSDVICADGQLRCNEGYVHHTAATCNDPCAFDCGYLAPLGMPCCDDAGAVVAEVTCDSTAGGLACRPSGSTESCSQSP